MMETVSCVKSLQRAGDGVSPVQVDTAENPSGVSFPKTGHRYLTEKTHQPQVRNDGDSPVTGTCIGTRMPVQCNRWYSECIDFVLLQEGDFFVSENKNKNRR